MDGNAGLGNGRASETLSQNVTITKCYCCSASSILLAWPQAASSQLLCADAITFPLCLWHGKSRTEGPTLLLWCWMSSTQRLPKLILSQDHKLSGLAGQPCTEGTSEPPILPGTRGTSGVTCRSGEEPQGDRSSTTQWESEVTTSNYVFFFCVKNVGFFLDFCCKFSKKSNNPRQILICPYLL